MALIDFNAACDLLREKLLEVNNLSEFCRENNITNRYQFLLNLKNDKPIKMGSRSVVTKLLGVFGVKAEMKIYFEISEIKNKSKYHGKQTAKQ